MCARELDARIVVGMASDVGPGIRPDGDAWLLLSLLPILFVSHLPWWLRIGLPMLRYMRPLLETAAYILTLAGLAEGWAPRPLAYLVLLSTVGMGMLLLLIHGHLQ